MSKTLQEWLSWQETLHPSEIELGLQRVAQVIKKLLPDCYDAEQSRFPFLVISVAGTNGKGSTVAMLESIYSEAGYRVGSYTSPHLLHYNERIKINKTPVDEQLICDSFERIDHAREELSLTYFEFGTLAAIDIIHNQSCDIAILEVGLGGRLDAVNVIDPDIALITTVDLDHQDWLGSDRNTIGLEKAGIYRRDKPALYGDSDLPDSIKKMAIEQQLDFYQYSVDYHYSLRKNNDTELSSLPLKTENKQFNNFNHTENVKQWDWITAEEKKALNSRYNLPAPSLKGAIQFKNAANVLMVLELMKGKYPVTQAEIKRGLHNTQLSGRFQVVSSDPLIIIDVAHNVQAAKILRQSCEQLGLSEKLHVIVGMLSDKDVAEVITIIAPIVDSWRIIELDSPRAMPAVDIAAIVSDITGSKINQQSSSNNKCIKIFDNFKQAYEDYSKNRLLMSSNEKLLVFGSFYTATAALKSLGK